MVDPSSLQELEGKNDCMALSQSMAALSSFNLLQKRNMTENTMISCSSLCLDIDKTESISPSLGMSEMDVGLLSPFFSATSSVDTLSELSFPAVVDESSMMNPHSALTATVSNVNGCFNVSLF